MCADANLEPLGSSEPFSSGALSSEPLSSEPLGSSDADPKEETDDEPIEAESYTDSAYDDASIISDTTSISSSSITYIQQHGHRYDGEGRTLLPNDESEQDRLDFQHHIFKMLLDGAITSTKIPSGIQNILDVGTGTGIWAMEMGDTYTSATVTGVDISPIQPRWVPPNVRFEIDDITKPWLWRKNSFDFIHIRNMVGGIRDWPAIFAEALECLKPGGSIEVSEIRTHFQCQDGTFEERGKACKEWEETFHKIAGGMGIDFDPILKVPAWLESVGFEDVEVDSQKIPVGPWPKDPKLKEIGRWYLSHLLDGGMENYSVMLFTKAGWDIAEVHLLLGEVRKQVKDSRMHSFTNACFVKAVKPPI